MVILTVSGPEEKMKLEREDEALQVRLTLLWLGQLEGIEVTRVL